MICLVLGTEGGAENGPQAACIDTTEEDGEEVT